MMSFSIQQKLFADILSIAVKLIEGKNLLPVVECAKLSFNDDGISVSTTNFSSWITLATPGFDGKNCAVALVPCKQLHSLVMALPKDQKITLVMTEKRLTVKASGSQYKFGSLSAEEWPGIEWNEPAEKIKIAAKTFCAGFGLTLPSCGRDDTRHYLNGVHLEMFKNKTLRFMASNGHCASLASIILEKNAVLPASTISREIVTLYLELLGRLTDEAEVTFELSESKARLEFGGEYSGTLIHRLIDGHFPEIDRLVPYERKGADYLIPREALLDAVRRINIIAQAEKERSGFIIMEFTETKLKIRAKSGDNMDAEEVIKIEGAKKECTIGVNASLLLNLLSSLEESDSVVIKINPEGGTDVIIIADPETEIASNAKAFSICMPMRI